MTAVNLITVSDACPCSLQKTLELENNFASILVLYKLAHAHLGFHFRRRIDLKRTSWFEGDEYRSSYFSILAAKLLAPSFGLSGKDKNWTGGRA